MIYDFLEGAQDPNKFVKYYLADNTGINLDHTQASPEIVNDQGISLGLSGSPIKFSPNGEYVGFSNVIAKFNATTGEYTELITNVLSRVPFIVTAASFSPNSRYYYVAGSNAIWRFDLEATDIEASGMMVTELANSRQIGDLQLAPDGNIYTITYDFNNPNTTPLGVILCPNTVAPCFQEDIYSFPGTFGQFGLPNFLDHYFEDDNLNNDLEVCTDISGFQICDGEQIEISVEHYLANEITWSTGESSPFIIVTQPGVYAVTVSDGCCNEYYEEFEIFGNGESFDLEIEGPSVICEDEAIELTTNAPSSSMLLWSNGSDESTISVNEPGTYGVTITSECSGEITEQSTEIEILQINEVELELNIEGDLSCAGQVIASVNNVNGDISWSTGETSNEITITEPGTYEVNVTNSCATKSESFTLSQNEGIYEMPNAFTPDNDGYNDTFKPVWGSCAEISDYAIIIFNRWGNKVFESNDPQAGWDGRYNQEPAVQDIFFYDLQFNAGENNRIQSSGDITIIR